MSEAAVLTAPNETVARERTRRRRVPEPVQRRDLIEDFAEVEEDDGGYNAGRRRTGLRLTFRGGLPQSVWGRVSAGIALLAILGVGWAAVDVARRMVLHDERFVLATASAVSVEGNHHLTRGQLLEVFGADIERNILWVSLESRKAELEQIPWVKHATVMRLLPDHISVSVQERTPVAFVRQGGHVGLVDAAGVLLDMGADRAENGAYSFPVVTGIVAGDPLSLRAARMKLYAAFTQDLDATGDAISAKLSEVDLSNPEDVKALIPDRGTEVLVHFGDSDYLDRYRKYESHLPEWRAQYPKLSSVDMRYERQVVLEMQPGTAVPLAAQPAETVPAITPKANVPAGKAHAQATAHPRAGHAAVHLHMATRSTGKGARR